ncbi:cysteine--tRNA ligase [soil metagenome]
MPIVVHDSLTRRRRPLATREPGRVAMYVCGPTVYNRVHIGNARTFLWFDFIRRYLVYRGSEVTYVMNYTDVDDKIIERARTEKTEAHVVAKKYERAFEVDLAALGVQPPDIVAKATDHIEDMVEAIERLIEKGAAYESGGDVFFSVESFPGYGMLSHRSLDDLRAERIEPSPLKRNPLDFALWNASKADEPSWSSPWGPGRPGWHIECSVMATKYLGMGFDVHGGAADLEFPHHENEIAQAETLAEASPFVRHWLHAGLVQMDAEKMSKSLGNFVLAGEVVERYSGEVARLWGLSGSYRTQVTFSERSLDDAAQAYERLRNFWESASHALGDDMPDRPGHPTRPGEDPDFGDGPGAPYLARFTGALDDDFNSPGALAALHDLVRAGNRSLEAAQLGDRSERSTLTALASAFAEMVAVLGFDFRGDLRTPELTGALIGLLLELRAEARSERAFERADAIRERLGDLGVVIEDTPAGPRWRIIRNAG